MYYVLFKIYKKKSCRKKKLIIVVLVYQLTSRNFKKNIYTHTHILHYTQKKHVPLTRILIKYTLYTIHREKNTYL